MNARMQALLVLWTAVLLPVGGAAYCQAAAPMVLDIAATDAVNWRVVLEKADAAPDAVGMAVQAYSVGEDGRKRRCLGFDLPFSSRTGFEAFTLRYAGTIPPSILLSELRVRVYGLNTPHSLAVLLRDGEGRLHEIDMGELRFDGWRVLTCRIRPPFGPASFAGVRVYALPGRLPRERRLLLLLGELELMEGSQ